jgi:TonB dependent receptor
MCNGLHFPTDIVTSSGVPAQINLRLRFPTPGIYRLGSHFGILEIGAKVRNAHKFQNATETVYDGWTPANYPMTMFLDPFTSTNYMGGYYFGGHYGQVSNFNLLQSFTLANLSSYEDGYSTASDMYPNIFDIIERISAGYIMDTMDFGRFHIMTGVRLEGTQLNALGYNVTLYPAGSPNCANPTGCGIPVPVTNSPTYVDVLPSFSVKYRLDSNSAIRAVYARGVSRPDLYQMVPYVTEDDSTNPPTIAEGNPNLKPEHANNYDLLYERYLNPTGMVRAGFFFKQITDTLISASYNATSGQYAGDLISQWLNVGNGEIHGFEASYQQRLSMLPGALRGLGMMANYTWTGSGITNLPGPFRQPGAARLDAYSAEPWPRWPVPPGNLTPHGYRLIELMGSYYREWLRAGRLLGATGCQDATRIDIHADREPRTRETGRAFAQSLLPGCAIAVRATDSRPAPLFSGFGTPDPQKMLAAVRERLGADPQKLVADHRVALETLQSILKGKSQEPVRSAWH